jgi:hypothetical protein
MHPYQPFPYSVYHLRTTRISLSSTHSFFPEQPPPYLQYFSPPSLFIHLPLCRIEGGVGGKFSITNHARTSVHMCNAVLEREREKTNSTSLYKTESVDLHPGCAPWWGRGLFLLSPSNTSLGSTHPQGLSGGANHLVAVVPYLSVQDSARYRTYHTGTVRIRTCISHITKHENTQKSEFSRNPTSSTTTIPQKKNNPPHSSTTLREQCDTREKRACVLVQ